MLCSDSVLVLFRLAQMRFLSNEEQVSYYTQYTSVGLTKTPGFDHNEIIFKLAIESHIIKSIPGKSAGVSKPLKPLKRSS